MDNKIKKCNCCKEEKQQSEFPKDKYKKDGLNSHCKNCRNNYSKKHYKKNKEYFKNYKKNNIEKTKEYLKEYNLKNKDKILNNLKKRKKLEPLFKLTCNIRNLISNSFNRNGYKKESKTFEYLGCSFQEFKQHLEKQFTEGMTWENQGEWHLDHIYPVSLAKDEEHLIRLNHYTNFQPLWAVDNIKKGNKIL